MAVQVQLTDRHQHHSNEVKDYALEKVEKLTRFFDQVQSIEIVFDVEHEEHTVEINVSANHHLHFVGHCTNASVMKSIDRVVEKLEKQVIKAKQRLKDHHRGDPSKGPS
jgi:putative sigma-54 modulation protein